jgi:hypothetical protein
MMQRGERPFQAFPANVRRRTESSRQSCHAYMPNRRTLADRLALITSRTGDRFNCYARLVAYERKRMKIDIERIGLTEVQVDPEMVFTFTYGISEFEASKRFKLFHEDRKPSLLSISGILRKAACLVQEEATA